MAHTVVSSYRFLHAIDPLLIINFLSLSISALSTSSLLSIDFFLVIMWPKLFINNIFL
jgi:hypothetical protein